MQSVLHAPLVSLPFFSLKPTPMEKANKQKTTKKQTNKHSILFLKINPDYYVMFSPQNQAKIKYRKSNIISLQKDTDFRFSQNKAAVIVLK